VDGAFLKGTIRVVMITGDARPMAEAVGRELGVDEVFAGLAWRADVTPAGRGGLIERRSRSGADRPQAAWIQEVTR
jgi:magnesium-transporting ATPase (P-type)